MYRRNFVKAGIAGIGSMTIARAAMALTAKTSESDEKSWAVIYGSKCGSTKKTGGWINDGMGNIADVLDVDGNPDFSKYEYLIIGGWINTAQGPGKKLIDNVASFVKKNKDALKPKIMGLYTLCGNNGDPVGDKQIKDYLEDQIVSFSGVTDKPAKLFNGVSGCPNDTYKLLSEEKSVDFGKEILSTAVKTINRKSEHPFMLHKCSYSSRQSVTPIGYSIPVSGKVKVTVCSINGTAVTTLVSEHQKAGAHMTYWDTKHMAPGVYLYQLKSAGLVATETIQIF